MEAFEYPTRDILQRRLEAIDRALVTIDVEAAEQIGLRLHGEHSDLYEAIHAIIRVLQDLLTFRSILDDEER